MRISHVNVPMPRGGEPEARRFYGALLGLAEIAKPDPFENLIEFHEPGGLRT